MEVKLEVWQESKKSFHDTYFPEVGLPPKKKRLSIWISEKKNISSFAEMERCPVISQNTHLDWITIASLDLKEFTVHILNYEHQNNQWKSYSGAIPS